MAADRNYALHLKVLILLFRAYYLGLLYTKFVYVYINMDVKVFFKQILNSDTLTEAYTLQMFEHYQSMISFELWLF